MRTHFGILASTATRIVQRSLIVGTVLILAPAKLFAGDLSISPPTAIDLGTSADSPSLSPNAPLVAYRSFDGQGSQQFSQIKLKDLRTGEISQASTNNNGESGDGDSKNPVVSAVSPEGLFVTTFDSDAANFSSSSISAGRRVYAYAPRANFFGLASFALNANRDDANDICENSSPVISPDANQAFVAYASDATNLVNDANDHRDVFLLGLVRPTAGTIADGRSLTRLSVSEQGVESDGDSDFPKVSGNGQFVVFQSNATNLIDGRVLASKTSQIYLYTVATGALSLISQTASSVEGDGDSSAPQISYSGTRIVYKTRATNLAPNDTSTRDKIVVFDATTGTTSVVDTSHDGLGADSDALEATISPDGRFVAFTSYATNIVPNDTNLLSDIFLRDVKDSKSYRLSVTTSGAEVQGSSYSPTIGLAAYGSTTAYVAFRSSANLTEETGGELGGLYFTTISLPTPTLEPDTKIEVPPAVAVTNKNISVVMQEFSLADDAGAASILGKKEKKTIGYDVRLENTKRKKDRKSTVSRRNTVTFRNVKPGTYDVRYRVVAMKGKRIVQSSSFSPKIRVTVGGKK